MIALTANAISGAKEMYLQTGFSDFLSKPIRPEKLERMIVEYLPSELLQKAEGRKAEKRHSKTSRVKQEILDSLPDIEGIDWEYALLHMKDVKLLQDTARETGMTVVIITHNQAIVDMADRIITVKNGQIGSVRLNANPVPVEEIEW